MTAAIQGTPTPLQTGRSACYVYCVALVDQGANLGAIGIEGQEVSPVLYQRLGALVHDGPALPYQTHDQEVAQRWVLAHHQVVEEAQKRWGTVLPMTFNTIVVSDDSGSARDNLLQWLQAEEERLKQRLAALEGRAEYGVQIFWDPAKFSRTAGLTSPEIRRLTEETQSLPRGLAYMYRQRAEQLLRQECEMRAATLFREIHARLRACSAETRLEKGGQRGTGQPTLMNLSCLVDGKDYPLLVCILESTAVEKEISFRLVGPFPPYSFC